MQAGWSAPRDVTTPPGAAGWRDMYPEHLLFTEENGDWENSAFWLHDSLHHPGVKYPFDSVVNEAIRLTKGQWTSRVFALPGGYGTEHRILNGYSYLSPVPVTDAAERAARAEVFAARSRTYYAQWEQLHQRWLDRVLALISETEALHVPGLPGLEDDRVLHEGAVAASSRLLLERYDAVLANLFAAWQHHFELLTLGYAAYLKLYHWARQHFPGVTDQSVAQLLAGHDSRLFRAQEGVAQLTAAAVESGLDGLVRAHGYAEAVPLLRGRQEGRDWLESWRKLSDPWFNIATDSGLNHRSRSWRDHPDVVWQHIRRRLDDTSPGARAPEAAVRRRRAGELADSYRRLLPSPDAREQFDEALSLARRVSAFVEDHSFYLENWFHLAFWRKIREFADVMAGAGLLAARDDVFLLNRFEVAQALYETAASWGTGAPTGAGRRLGERVRRRRGIIAALERWEPPAHLGEEPTSGGDPAMRMLFGTGTALPQPRHGLSGHPASPGRATGPVRLVENDTDLTYVQPGEILVARTASAVWTGVFDVIGGFVTEIGGVMAHAAIVAREYAVPAVVGVPSARGRLSTGQLVVLDGTTGTVTPVGENGEGGKGGEGGARGENGEGAP
ncbi:PEP-utilizing enzyme [Streptomyces iconiensis]|uniref:PEP-utilizing enzyme n=1 Tax=Streptomyces iconiensis TaxID=1384038 RepID=A0ABT6ZZF6_9ACTN|nr:PEP-utilizing enzyme [Streptomyces iconiensis]MDJ1134463.1 PEP-utilizing enzyme [Streptomyces iconiensis]